MKVRYTVTLNDFVTFHIYITKKSGVNRRGYLVIWLGFPILLTAFATWSFLHGYKIAALPPTALTVYWLLLWPSRYWAGVARNARTFVKNLGGRGVIGERMLILSEEMLIAISETIRTEVRWENMTGVDVVGDCTYIFISGISALILPRHGFESDAEYEAVRDFALRKLEGQVAA